MFRSICLLFTFALLSAQPLQAQSSEADAAQRMFEHGVEMQQAGDYIGAIDAYKTVLSIDPKRLDAMSNMGAAYVHLGQFDDGIAQYKAALALDPQNLQVRLNLGLAFYKSGRVHAAIDPLKAVADSPQPPKNALLLLGDCYLQIGRPADVVALLQPREALFDNDLAFAYVLGMALLQTDNERDGQRYIDRIFSAGDSAEAHLLLAIAHLNKLSYPPAKEELEKAMKLNPRLPTLNSAYGRALLGVGDTAAAEQAFRREIAVNPNDFEANLMLGSLRRSAQDFDTALIYLTRALEIHPGDLTARKLVASLKLQTGAVDEAVTMLEEIVKDAPDMVDAHVQLATAYNRLKRKDDADRERAIVERLNQANQAKESGAAVPATPSGSPQPLAAGQEEAQPQ
jgi:tetratricopeptide (TPR) repeat protein